VISGHTQLYGVVGHPVGQTLSPAMHNAAFHEVGLDAVYVALPVSPEGLSEGLRGARALGFQGLNVTVPHKQRAAELCLRLDRTAEQCGAANTLRHTPHGWEGFNTDAPACLALLQATGVRRGARALLLGAGGAALAAAWALLSVGTQLTVAARRLEAARELCRRVSSAFASVPGARAMAWEEAPALARSVDVIANATSIGLGGSAGVRASHQDGLPPFRFHRGQVAVDFVYSATGDTPFARLALADGASVVTGEQLLVRQGALAFTLWTGQPAPEAVMAAALRAATHPPP
jgi:shikimate dehydrogenase